MADETVKSEPSVEDEPETSVKSSPDSNSIIQQEPVLLNYCYRNSVKYVFRSLKNGEDDAVAKSKLQVVCANLCRVWNIPFSPEYINGYKDTSVLSLEEFLSFLETYLLPKGLKNESRTPVPIEKVDDICWVVFIKEHQFDGERLLTDKDAMMLWKVYKKIDILGKLTIDKQEVAIAFENFHKAIGAPWTPVPMDKYSRKEDWTFWDFLDCLEKNYLKGMSKSVYKEGLDAVVNMYVTEVVKSGFLTKKGHRVKSMKERWFVLLPGTLTYYAMKGSLEKKGEICINESCKIESNPDTRTVKCRFTVTCGDRQVKYEIDAPDQRTKNEWMTAVQNCIDCVGGPTPLEKQLTEREKDREKQRADTSEEERRRLEQEALIQKQLEELEILKREREKAEAHAVQEAALLEEERKRRRELEEVKEEYERLLAEEKAAREAEEEVRLLQEKILDHEREKRLELEMIKTQQDKILLQERERREGLEVESKEQARVLEEERQKMKELQEAREKAEAEVAEAQSKLAESEAERRKAAEAVEAAKQRTRSMKMPTGLARPLQGGSGGIVTHRGPGAFTDDDFSKVPQYLRDETAPKAVNATSLAEEERAVIVESHLVKPSESKDGKQQQE